MHESLFSFGKEEIYQLLLVLAGMTSNIARWILREWHAVEQ